MGALTRISPALREPHTALMILSEALERHAPVGEVAENPEGEFHRTVTPRGLIGLWESPYNETVEMASLLAVDRYGDATHCAWFAKKPTNSASASAPLFAPTSSPWREAGSARQLQRFYRHFGFVPDPARDEFWDTEGRHFLRPPAKSHQPSCSM